MIDVGANTGFYGETAILHGCDAIFFDMQPACVNWVVATLLANNFAEHGAVIPYGLSDRDQSIGRLNFSKHDCNIKENKDAEQARGRARGVGGWEEVEMKLMPLTCILASNAEIYVLKVT
jgi:hypothetical protein